MTALLRDAFQPNLVQTLEHNPALIHGGPFANIAHGCNSVMATRAGLRLGDYVVTEAGFGADLGAEKFFDIKCRSAGLSPAAAVVVATVRALKMHGGVARADLAKENVEALASGLANLERHIGNLRKFGIPVVVGINRFGTDTQAELDFLLDACRAKLGVPAHIATHFSEGSKGSEALAQTVIKLADSGAAQFNPLYPDDMPVEAKIRTVAQSIYGAGDIELQGSSRDDLKRFEQMGFGSLPVCIAKTQYSFSTDPNLRGAPSGHIIPVRQVRLSAGAGFVVAICGDIMTMPGLPREPAALRIGLDAQGNVEGLF
jgi:formate--tetrahydrofolate ligase